MLKKKKFCQSCKKNIMCCYENLKGEWFSMKEEQEKRRYERAREQECVQTNTQYVDENGEVTIYEEKQCNDPNCENCRQQENNCEEEEEFPEDCEEEYTEEEESGEGSCSDMQDCSQEDYDDSDYQESEEDEEEDNDEDFETAYRHHLIRHVQYSMNKKDPFVISPKYFQRFIAKSHNDFCELKHANTAKSACDEIVSCIGEILKEKLLNLWKVKKSDD